MWRDRYRAPRIIQPGGGSSRWLILLFVVAVLISTHWVFFDQGRQWSSNSDTQRIMALKRQQRQLDRLQLQREELQRQVAVLERSSQMDQETVRALQERIKALQSENLQSDEELAFLRGLLSTENEKAGLRISQFRLHRTQQEHTYRFRFTVSQALKNNGVAKGQILFKIEGKENSKPRTLMLEQITEEKIKGLTIQFRHYQNIEGKLNLPEGFLPDSVIVDIRPAGKKLTRITETFQWVVGG